MHLMDKKIIVYVMFTWLNSGWLNRVIDNNAVWLNNQSQEWNTGFAALRYKYKPIACTHGLSRGGVSYKHARTRADCIIRLEYNSTFAPWKINIPRIACGCMGVASSMIPRMSLWNSTLRASNQRHRCSSLACWVVCIHTPAPVWLAFFLSRWLGFAIEENQLECQKICLDFWNWKPSLISLLGHVWILRPAWIFKAWFFPIFVHYCFYLFLFIP